MELLLFLVIYQMNRAVGRMPQNSDDPSERLCELQQSMIIDHELSAVDQTPTRTAFLAFDPRKSLHLVIDAVASL
jgi:hypothetical protein